MLKTRITELLGIEYPIVAGGMQWLSRAEFAAAVSNAGALGTLTAATHATKEELVAEIRKTRELTDRPFGVNISMLPDVSHKGLTDIFVEAVIREKVPVVETSGRSPEEYVPDLKKAGVKIIHKVPAVRFALKAQRVGVDAVTIVGYECGGHPGMDDVTTLAMIPKAARLLTIPVLAGGGVADARGFLAALAMGAEGVVMGTRFMATRECIAHDRFKDWIVNASETDTLMIMRSIRNPLRAMKNSASLKVLEMEGRGASLEELLTVIGGKAGKKALFEGDLENGVISLGQCIGNIDSVLTVREVVQELAAGAVMNMERLKRIFS